MLNKKTEIFYKWRDLRKTNRDFLEEERILLDKQEKVAKFYCAECGLEIYDGENVYYHINDDIYLHKECLEEYAKQFVRDVTIGDDYYSY